MKVVNRLPELIEAKKKEYEAKNGKLLKDMEIALQAGVDPATLSRYKKGKVDSINWEVWQKLCNYFDVAGHEIFDIQKETRHKRNTG